MAGAMIRKVELRRADLRFPFPARFMEHLTGTRFACLRRRAKYLLIDTENGWTVISHLGMSGSFRFEIAADGGQPGTFHHPKAAFSRHDHVVLDLITADGSTASVTYNDPRRFGFMLLSPTDEIDRHPMIASLGIEPLSNNMKADALATRMAGRSTSLKAALLDQRLIAGLGNIYVCEALFRAGLSPLRAASTLATATGRPTASAQRLAAAIRSVLEEALVAGGSSLRDHRQADGSLGYFQHRFCVYDREGEPCRTSQARMTKLCTGVVRRMVQNGRSTFYCPACQR